MELFFREVRSELTDNWPAFLYIATTTAFSICFLRERRAETRILKELGAGLQESIRRRFDRLEQLVNASNRGASPPEVATVYQHAVARQASTDN
jgi:hypothetical protein